MRLRPPSRPPSFLPGEVGAHKLHVTKVWGGDGGLGGRGGCSLASRYTATQPEEMTTAEMALSAGHGPPVANNMFEQLMHSTGNTNVGQLFAGINAWHNKHT